MTTQDFQGPESLESLVPQVVAVVVAADPGDWFEECLGSLAAQDYPELSVLVLDASSREGLRSRVASVLPAAYVRRLDSNQGFGPSANAVLGMVEGASHFLFCHDDVALDPDAVAVLVEESFRSNAGVVGPKLVSWEDPHRLLHAGMAADKAGGVVDRVEPGEVDHGQHDSVRDVFLVSGGCTLVRADLFATIGGFDPRIFVMGEDLDLCWRAQVAGARVVVAPGARVRHRELLAGAMRPLPEAVHVAVPTSPEVSAQERAHGAAGEEAAGEEAAGEGAAEEEAAAAEGAAEEGAAEEGAAEEEAAEPAPDSIQPGPGGEANRARRAGLRRRTAVHRQRPRRRTEQVTLQSLQRRHELRAVLKNYSPFHLARVLPQVAMLQLGEVIVTLVTGHVERAAAVLHAWRWNFTERSSLRKARADLRRVRVMSDSDVRRLQLHGSARLSAYLRRAVTHGMRAARLGVLDEPEVDGPEPTAQTLHDAELRRIAIATRPARVTIWAVAALVLVFGSRQLLASGFPYVGQLLPFPTWSSFLHSFFSGWQPSGVGTLGAASPANGFLGLGGLVLVGGTGLLQKVVVLGCVPAGAWGMARLAGSFGSVRARLVAAIAYLAVPLPYDAFATARWDALLAYAACPWIALRLARATGEVPLRTSSVQSRPLPRWRTTVAGRAVGLSVLEALFTSAAPTGAVLTLVITAGLALGLLVARGRRSFGAAGRVLGVGAGATVITAALLLPWSVSTLQGTGRWQVLLGVASSPGSGASWGSLLHLGIGPVGDTPLAWGFLAAATLPLLVATGRRLTWAATSWTMASGALLLAWASGRAWLGALRLPGEMLLVPAVLGTALAIGLGVAAFEDDLWRHRFGWRQIAAGLAAALGAVATVPFLSACVSGRWELPSNGYGQATSFMARAAPGPFRVLWLGDPGVLPGQGLEVQPGLAYQLSEQGLPDARSLWASASIGPAANLASDVRMASSGRTVQLGRLLAPYAVRYVVVLGSLGVVTPGSTLPLSRPVPAQLTSGLGSQIDLRQVVNEQGLEIFVDQLALPERALLPLSPSGHPLSALPAASGEPSPGWVPVLPGVTGSTELSGRLRRGTLFDAVAPAGAWELVGRGGNVQHGTLAFGYGARFEVARTETLQLRFVGSWRHGLAVAVEIALWVLVLMSLGLRRRRAGGWLRDLAARRHRTRSERLGEAEDRADGNALSDPPRQPEVVG